MIRFGIIRFGSVNDTEASVFGYSVFTRFDRPLVHVNFVKSLKNKRFIVQDFQNAK